MIKVDNLTKKYGRQCALNGFNINIEKGDIIGILGPNGSGKSTFMKIAAGLLPKTEGEILIQGEKPGAITKGNVSYLTDSNSLPEGMKVKEAMAFYQTFYKDFDSELFKELMKNMRMAGEYNKKVKSLSKGMQQKLRLALTMGRKAKIYLLDEPLGGIDPLAREEILDAMLMSLNEDATLVITTHLVEELERILGKVVFIKEGKNIGQYNCEELRSEEGMSTIQKYKEVFRNA